jgi:c-di-GMP-binding flagellar brake protein YcgR
MSIASRRSYEPERREFVRVRAQIPVRYKFLSHDPDFVCDEIFEGSTNNISGGGMLLVASIPNLDWLTGLLMERIVIGVNILLPDNPDPIKALTRTAWIESLDERTRRCSIGLRFKEITKESQDRIFQFVIRSQMP